MASLRTWFKATQPQSFVASLVGVALGTAIAWDHRRTFDLAGLVLAAIGVVCLHAGTNMSNDSIDFQRGVDDLPPHLVSPFTGGARVLPDAAVSLEAHRRVWIGFFAVAAVIGLVLAVTRPNGWILLVLGAVGGGIGVFYTLPHLALQYHGVGEIAVALVFLAALSILQIVPWIAVLGLVAVLPLRRAIAILRLHYREYPAHIPANAATIQAVLLLGVAMTAAYLVAAQAGL